MELPKIVCAVAQQTMHTNHHVLHVFESFLFYEISISTYINLPYANQHAICESTCLMRIYSRMPPSTSSTCIIWFRMSPLIQHALSRNLYTDLILWDPSPESDTTGSAQCYHTYNHAQLPILSWESLQVLDLYIAELTRSHRLCCLWTYMKLLIHHCMIFLYWKKKTCLGS